MTAQSSTVRKSTQVRGLEGVVVDLSPLVRAVVRANGVAAADTDDVAQTVWLALVRHFDGLDDRQAVAAWLITTARREAQRVCSRDRATEPLDVALETIPSNSPLPEVELLKAERDRELWRAFRRLPARSQELIRRTVLSGRVSYQGVATDLRMPVGSIGPSRARALRALRAELAVVPPQR